MITTLDTQPQEWMDGNANTYHTIAACTFDNIDHIEHWIEKLVPKNKDGKFVKWSAGKRNFKFRDDFIDNCINNSRDIDFQVNCISTNEGEMSWFAWAFYMQNKKIIRQETDRKNRNNLVFQIDDNYDISFPVLRAGYLIWYHHVLRYLADVKQINGKFLSDNFASDEVGPVEGKAKGVSFINFLLSQSNSNLQISLPTNDRYKNLDRISDYFCGWVNSVRSQTAINKNIEKFEELTRLYSNIDAIVFNPKLEITDEYGNNITSDIMNNVTS